MESQRFGANSTWVTFVELKFVLSSWAEHWSQSNLFFPLFGHRLPGLLKHAACPQKNFAEAKKMPEKQQKSWLEEGGDWWRRCGVLLRGGINLKSSRSHFSATSCWIAASILHMKAMYVPFQMGYGGLICSKRLQSDRRK